MIYIYYSSDNVKLSGQVGTSERPICNSCSCVKTNTFLILTCQPYDEYIERYMFTQLNFKSK